jgi:hypothetical protein
MKGDWLILFTKTVAVYFDNHNKHLCTLFRKMQTFFMLEHVVPIVTLG